MDLNNPTFSYNYNQDINDPELAGLRSRALNINADRRRQNLNELSRAGLIGSSAGFDQIGQNEQRMSGDLTGIDSDFFARRRAEAFQSWRDNLAYQREIALQKLQHHLLPTDLSGLGSLLPLIGGMIPGADTAVSGASNLFSYGLPH